MSADRPVSAPDTVTDDLRMVAYRAARAWAAEHRHPQPDDRMIDAGLEAVVPLIRAQVAAELVAEAARAAHDRPAEFTAAYLGEWLARQPITLDKPTTVAAPSTVILAEDFHEPDGADPDMMAIQDWDARERSEAVDYGTPSPSDVDSVTYASGGGFRSVGVDFEPDEPVADVAAAFDAADKGVTRRPAKEPTDG